MKLAQYLIITLFVTSLGGIFPHLQGQGPEYEEIYDEAEPVYPTQGVVGGTIEDAGNVVADIGGAIGEIL